MAVQPSSGPKPSDTTWRTLVLLVCLAVLPLAALRGTNWRELGQTVPDLAKRLLNGRWGLNSAFAKGMRSGTGSEASQAANLAAQSSTPRKLAPGSDRPPAREPVSDEEGRRPAPQPQRSVEPAQRPIQPAAFEQRAGDSSGGLGSEMPAAQVAETRAVLAGDPWPEDRRDQASRSPAPTDRFLYVLERFRELGAVYYLLETWGNSGQYFRFHCRMAIGGSPSHTRYFEATDPDAMQAMTKVLSEVETWRAGN